MTNLLSALIVLAGAICLLFFVQCTGQTPKTAAASYTGSKKSVALPKAFPEGEKMEGLNFVAPPEPFSQNPMPDVEAVGANWIAVIPYAYTRKNEPKVHYDNSKWQWWGERPEGCTRTVELAKEQGLKVMLKPQVYVPGSWTGDLAFTEEEWTQWEQDYRDYMLPMAKMAEQKKVDLLCIGTELKLGVQQREAFWRAFIKEVRALYSGKLVYAANWDEYELVPFWDALDYVGVNAYFPLVNEATPDVAALVEAWQPTVEKMRAFYEEVQKPILFTEFGYLSVDGCAYNTWELEGKIKQVAINEQAQANALEGLFRTFWPEPYWHGGFLWKWFPNMRGHEGYPAKDYTPQGKIGEQALKKWYSAPKEEEPPVD